VKKGNLILGAVIDTVDSVAGAPVLEEFLEKPIQSSVTRMKNYIADHPELRVAATSVFKEAVDEAKSKDKQLTYKDAANIARDSWDKLSMRFGIQDEGGNTKLLPKPSRALARRLAKEFVGKDGTLSEYKFQQYRKALMDHLMRDVVKKRIRPQVSHYLLGMVATTALVAAGRTHIPMNGTVEKVVNFLFPSIVVGPVLGAAMTFKLKGGSYEALGHDVAMASNALGQARQTLKWTHDTLQEAAYIRDSVNRTKLLSTAKTIWNLFSTPAEKLFSTPAGKE